VLDSVELTHETSRLPCTIFSLDRNEASVLPASLGNDESQRGTEVPIEDYAYLQHTKDTCHMQ